MVYERGEKVTNPNMQKVLYQLAQPNSANPVFAIGSEPPALVRGRLFGVTTDLHKVVSPHHEQSLIFNATPKYSLVDLHIGQ